MRPIESALSARQLALQSMNTEAFRRVDWPRPADKLLTMHSAKWLEFRLVFVAGLQALPMRDEPLEEAIRLPCVAMTRASRQLVLSAHGDSAVVRRVRESLRNAAVRFASP